jgi:2-polyprenyl-3-methyl-5-hydroxy-6-metoxy-1,4-benzoquinol methylase
VSDQIVSGKSAAYRDASEALHRGDPSWVRRAAHYRMLDDSGFRDLIRDDFLALFAFSETAEGALLDAGCGAGGNSVDLACREPGLSIHGVDISSVALGMAAKIASGGTRFYQASLERLPFADAVFDYVASHEVIEHVEDPALVARELGRVLRPGGVCVIATPNGASLWIEHLRQRAMRGFGRRGAAVGADHTRSPGFWRRIFAASGLIVECQIYDGAALEFQIFVAPARWMPMLSRMFEPLRAVPLLNLLLCDRVKFRLRKPGTTPPGNAPVNPCCPICYAALAATADGVVCGAGHRFARNGTGFIDFTTLAAGPAGASPSAGGQETFSASPRQGWLRLGRRAFLLALTPFYGAFLLLMAPLGLAVGRFHQPFTPPPCARR